MSGDALGADLDLEAVLDIDHVGDVGLPNSAALLAFTNAAQLGRPELAKACGELAATVGEDGLREAAATIAVFNGLVRVADGTGIQLDAGLDSFSADDRMQFGIDAYAGAANTPATGPRTVEIGSIGDLFG